MLSKEEKEMLFKCINTEIGFICHNIASRATMKVDSQDYKEYLDNLTKQDKEYLKKLENLQKKIIE